jgi:predicted short-subunit dehydrogenase-like oxidoreductase (DUF2520 family)
MGGALALALSRAGLRIDAVLYRNTGLSRSLVSKLNSKPQLISIDKVDSISSPILFITTQDQELPEIPDLLAAKTRPGTIVFHTSGSSSSDILKPFAERGCITASFHPLASITNWSDGPERFRGAYFCLEGADKAVRTARSLVRKLGGQPFVIAAADKPLYHAAAVTAAGHVTALFDVALSLMIKSGLDRRTARRVLQPLLLGVAENLASHDTPAALTGTFARGDEATLRRHLEALNRKASWEEAQIYRDLALRSIKLAEQNGLDTRIARRMRRTIKIAKDAGR